mmetsp:Transcript_969/g.3069  ORF Transcript_969/g.3069 Transcript_969/m.3069 type:complete len:505 (-) Transcript_969:368-1882(-)
MIISCLALGSRGDVEPLLALAEGLLLKESLQDLSVRIACRNEIWNDLASCSPPLPQVSHFPIRSCSVDMAVALHAERRSQEPPSKAVGREDVKRFEEEERAELLQACHGADVIVCNLFTLEGFHISEKMRIPCVIVSPCLPPNRMPATFERQFMDEFPLLYRKLKASARGLEDEDALSRPVCWSDVTAWMWRVFLDDHGTWREQCLGLPAIPLDKFEEEGGEPLPQAPLLLLTVSQRLLALDESDQFLAWKSCARFVGNQVRESSKSVELDKELMSFLSSSHSLQAGDRVETSAPSRTVCVCFGSMPSLGFLESAEEKDVDSAEAFLVTIMRGLKSLNLRCVWMLQGFHPTIKSKLERAAGACVHHHFFTFVAHPHALILPHCFAMIHHGGAGSVAAAIRHGCMHIVFPLTFDQIYWAVLLERAGLACRAQPWRSVTDESIKSSLQFAMDHYDIRLAMKGGQTDEKDSPLLQWKMELQKEEECGREKSTEWMERVCRQVAASSE